MNKGALLSVLFKRVQIKVKLKQKILVALPAREQVEAAEIDWKQVNRSEMPSRSSATIFVRRQFSLSCLEAR